MVRRATAETIAGSRMTMISLGQAAKLAGLGKTTIARAIKSGRLSATRRDDGGYHIDVAELERVYPLRAPAEPTGATGDATGPAVRSATGDATGSDLTGEIAALRATAALMREQIADLREDRDRWRGVAERLAIAPPAPSPASPPEPEVTPKRSLWRWLRSTG
jgi:hypothetical protein